MSKAIPAIILAAGASRRLGEDKALLEVAGNPLVALVAQRLSVAGCTPIVIVTRAELAFACLGAVPECKVAINKSPQEGRTGSIQVGLLALGEDNGRLPKAVLIVPLDRPGWSMSTLEKVVNTEGCVCPEKDGRGGHPLRISGTEVKAIMAAPSDTSLRQLTKPQRILVEDEFLHLNIDTPEDMVELERWASQSDGLSR
jgi:CTP:molybdopterin cytidylyltransferase MocA